MNREQMLDAVDQEIARLQEVRRLLSIAKGKARKQPSGAHGQPKRATAKNVDKQGKRQLSPEARKRIADAQKRRWAAVRAGK